MRLTTIGTGTVAPHPSRVCAAHLVESGDVRLLLDCGHGAVHRMAALGLDWTSITHVAISHFHPDHVGDLPLLIMAWRYGTLPPRIAPVTLVGPPGTIALIEVLATALGDWLRTPDYPLAIEELAAGASLELDSVKLSALKVPHTEESVAYSVEAESRRLVYTGDTGFDEGLAEWARGSNVLLAECSLPEEMALPNHLTPRQCGRLARVAEPSRLVLTHFYPPVEASDIAGDVRESFAGEVVLAEDGWSMEIEDA
ncbi:MAG: MBL fold metallo-hydrolase [Gemmatimonadaceae bacterium]